MFSRAYKTAVTVPPLVWVTVFLLTPYLLMFCYSFWSVSSAQVIVHHWSLDNYRELLRVGVYWQTLFRSMWIAARGTIFSLLLGYPLAYFLSFHAGVRKALFYQLVIIPLWVSYLVRAYAWKTILGSDGVLNTLLQYLHVTKHPLEFLLYSPFAVVLTLTHIYTPFAFLPIYASLEHIPRNLLEASHDLGATPGQTFWKVIFPLSIPGVVVGATFAFVLSLGDFLAPLLLGGPSGIMIANIGVSLFGIDRLVELLRRFCPRRRQLGGRAAVAVVRFRRGHLQLFQLIGACIDQCDIGGILRSQRHKTVDRRRVFARRRAQREQPLLDAFKLGWIEVRRDQRGVKMLVGLLQRIDRRVDRPHRGLDQRRGIGSPAFQPAHRRRQRRDRGMSAADGVLRLAQIGCDLLALHHRGAAFSERGLLAILGRQIPQFIGGMAQIIRLAGSTFHA